MTSINLKTDKYELCLSKFPSKFEGIGNMFPHIFFLPVFVKFCTEKCLHNICCLVRNILKHSHVIFWECKPPSSWMLNTILLLKQNHRKVIVWACTFRLGKYNQDDREVLKPYYYYWFNGMLSLYCNSLFSWLCPSTYCPAEVVKCTL